ncbi:MAG TPA: nucleotidyltransferase family protein [Thermoanaerobaculia bacterium]|nr:nucleotidyltransferase family protein [Thermoanaerobaculia bacterium]
MTAPLGRFLDRAARHAAALPAAEAVDWVLGHGLFSLARHPGLAAPLRQRLAEAAQRNLAANLFVIHRFQQVRDRLADIDVCPLKGIHLLDTVYRAHPGERRIGDLDLLVRRGDAEGAVAALADLGLEEHVVPGGDEAPERVLVDQRLSVEIHTRLGIKHGPRSAWEDLVPLPGELHDRRVHLLDRETTLVHLVAHWVKHGPVVELRWAEDILRWAAAGVDGAAALALARRLGAERTFVAGVRVLRTAAGDDLLPGVPSTLAGAAGRAIRWNERWLWRLDAADPFAVGRRSTALARNLTALLLADRPSDALSFFAIKARELVARRRAGAVRR